MYCFCRIWQLATTSETLPIFCEPRKSILLKRRTTLPMCLKFGQSKDFGHCARKNMPGERNRQRTLKHSDGCGNKSRRKWQKPVAKPSWSTFDKKFEQL